MDFIKNTNIIRPRSRKRVWAHNEKCSLPCKLSFKQMDMNKKNFVGGGTKRKRKWFLLWRTHMSCCLPEHTSNQPWPPPSSRGHECLCWFPSALWAPEVQQSPAGIAQHMPHSYTTPELFHGEGLLEAQLTISQVASSFPVQGWHWPLQLVPSVTSCCPWPRCPAAFASS